MVPSNLAIPDRANEEGRQNAAGASESDSQLLQGQKAVLQRRGGGPEQQSQSHHEKILRLPNLSHYRARALSLLRGGGISFAGVGAGRTTAAAAMTTRSDPAQ